MDSQNDNSRWLASTLRLTAFSQRNDHDGASSWWKTLFDEAPESSTTRSKEDFLQDEGMFHGHRLSLTTRPRRVDWLLVPVLDPLKALPENAFPSLGPFDDVLQPFLDPMHKWLSVATPFTRLAFGAVLEHPEATLQKAYEFLQPSLPNVRLDPKNSLEFLYQVNRPRDSRVMDGLQINRLSKWLGISGSLFVAFDDARQVRTQFNVARLELDISSPADNEVPLEAAKATSLLDELVSLGIEISVQGETG
ncbi:MAG: hypothetical protein ABI612_24685 [Betaproteobacteria bacterium]